MGRTELVSKSDVPGITTWNRDVFHQFLVEYWLSIRCSWDFCKNLYNIEIAERNGAEWEAFWEVWRIAHGGAR